ncbi:YeiH family protein [Pelobacter seleniigenes]|uniref:YeiH family protein n=1 Tax=Pelobacter seleniigenes TaxID=407188 RepID=UPI0004A6CF4B|nr:putative sulfate exporter family transporter [Pelobacter seleniigenes]
MRDSLVVKILFLCCLLLCLCPFMDAAYALLAGIVLSMAFGNPWPQQAATASKKLLQLSVVGLGFGLSLGEVWTTGRASIIYTFVGICFTLLLGTALGRLFKVEKRTASLVAFGTAICGGSAIAAMAPVLKAEDDEIAVSLATVFTLNAVALLLFPVIGHQLHLSQTIFGTWAGMAIHDTSSVVGAASVYGAKALAVGTTVKLSRALWITPFVLFVSWRSRATGKKAVPLFIIGFILAAAIRTALPQFASQWHWLALIAKQLLVVTLFLIGAGLSRELLRKVGVRPLLQGVVLWLLVGSLTLTCLELFGVA